MDEQTPVDDRSALAKAIGRASEVSTLAFTIAICFLLGYWLDNLCGTSPILAILGMTLGLVTAFRQLYKMAMRLSADDSSAGESDDQTSGNGEAD